MAWSTRCNLLATRTPRNGESVALPLLATKESLNDSVLSRGYTAMGEETLDPLLQKTGDTKEGYYIGREIAKTDPRYNPSKFYGPIVWPSADMSADRTFVQLWKLTLRIFANWGNG